tara:strand:- start:155 stop:397 length:243 start_codon:yes stop_codon:yes gene_type:complete
MTQNSEPTTIIKFSKSELEKLIWSLTIVKTMRLPIEPSWKVPYKTLLKELESILEDLNNKEPKEITEEEFHGKQCKNCET